MSRKDAGIKEHSMELAIGVLTHLPVKITSKEQLEKLVASGMPCIGPGIKERIVSLLRLGHSDEVEKLKKDECIVALQDMK